MLARAVAIALAGPFFASGAILHAQFATPSPDTVRVTVSMNADGTRTTYEFDPAHHRAVATTTGQDGKIVGKIRYTLDDAGRFASGVVYGPDDQLRFKAQYRYDTAGKLTQETQLGPDDELRNRIVYAYDKNGGQTGYTVYDAAGKVLRQTPGVSQRPTPPGKRK